MLLKPMIALRELLSEDAIDWMAVEVSVVEMEGIEDVVKEEVGLVLNEVRDR